MAEPWTLTADSGLWRQLLWRLGYGEEPCAHALPPVGPRHDPTRPALGEGGQRDAAAGALCELVRRQLAPPSSLEYLPPDAPPLRGRRWWASAARPLLWQPEVARLWTSVEDSGQRCEASVLCEAAFWEPVIRAFAAAIARFQSTHLLVTRGDPFPFGWGRMAHEAAICAYNTTWLLGASGSATPQAALSPVRDSVRGWLQTVNVRSQETEVGDLILLHLLARPFYRWQRQWPGGRADLLRRKGNLALELELARQVHQSFPWYGGWAARRRARAEITPHREAVAQVDRALARSDARGGELGDLATRWRLVDPIGWLTGESEAARVSSLGWLPGSVESGGPGWRHWIARRLARQVPGARTATLGPASPTEILLSTALAELLPDLPAVPDESDQRAWRRAHFLTLFFRQWARGCPAVADMARKVTGGKAALAREAHAPFFHALSRYLQWVEAIPSRRHLMGEQRKIQGELADRDFIDPEPWGMATINNLHDRLRAINQIFAPVQRAGTRLGGPDLQYSTGAVSR